MGDIKSTQPVFPKLPIIPSTIYHLAECRYDDYSSCTASPQLVSGRYDDCTSSSQLAIEKCNCTASSQLISGRCSYNNYTSCTTSSQLVTGKTQSCITTKPISLPSHSLHQSKNIVMFTYKNWFQCTTDADYSTLLRVSRQQ